MAEPMTAAFFEQRGADPATAAHYAAIENMPAAERNAHLAPLNNLAPSMPASSTPVPAATPPSSTPITPSAPTSSVISAQAEVDQIMADRASGKTNNAEWNAKASPRLLVLADLIANGGVQPTAPISNIALSDALQEHEAAKVASILSETKPINANDYKFAINDRVQPSDEVFEWQRQIREAASADGIEERIFNNMDANMYRNSLTIKNKDQADARIAANNQALAEEYGAELDAKIAAVDRLFDTWAKNPAFKQSVQELEKQPWLIDTADIRELVNLAEKRSKR